MASGPRERRVVSAVVMNGAEANCAYEWVGGGAAWLVAVMAGRPRLVREIDDVIGGARRDCQNAVESNAAMQMPSEEVKQMRMKSAKRAKFKCLWRPLIQRAREYCAFLGWVASTSAQCAG